MLLDARSERGASHNVTEYTASCCGQRLINPCTKRS